MKIKNSLMLLFCFGFFCSLISFFVLNLIQKKVFLLSSLEVYQIQNNFPEETKKQCLVVLNWDNQPISARKATQQIQTITGLKQEFELNLSIHPLILKNNKQIIIQNFNNNCQWLFKIVLVKVAETTLLDYLIYQLFNF